MIASLFALLPLIALASATPIRRDNNRLIESGRNSGLCLSVQGGRSAVAQGQVNDGTPVTTLSCSQASFWDISKGSGSVVVSGTKYALDIGLTPGNNGGVKVWSSYPASPQQTWYLTDDNRIAITGGNQCLDQGDNGPQTYQCTTGNTNQVWNVRFNDPQVSVTTSSAPAATSTASSGSVLPNVPMGTVIRDTAGGGQRLHPLGRDDLCMTVAGGFAGTGVRVGIADCFLADDPFAPLQLWDFPSGSGQVNLHNTPGMCLDAGSNPANAGEIKLWPCGGYPQQTWQYSGDNLKTTNNQCLDIRKESGASYEKPYITVSDLQTWECSTNGDIYQSFHTLN